MQHGAGEYTKTRNAVSQDLDDRPNQRREAVSAILNRKKIINGWLIDGKLVRTQLGQSSKMTDRILGTFIARLPESGKEKPRRRWEPCTQISAREGNLDDGPSGGTRIM